MRAPVPLHLVPALDLVELGDGRRVRLLDVLGRGSSSVVHRGLLETTNGVRRFVAVKLFGSVASEEAESVLAAAGRTATRAACVRHPNVVETYDYGQWRRQPFFVTELVAGVSLHALLERIAEKSRRLPLDIALFIASEMAEALNGARTARDDEGFPVGMLHLGLGPRKILLGWRGEVKVSDFETSITAAASSSVRSVGAVTHRTSTMAPEIAMGEPGDSRSDVFSAGVVLRELFVGPRFARNVTNTQAMRLALDGFVQPMSFQPHLPDALVQIMSRALRCDPGERYPDAGALAFELRRVALAMGVGDGRFFLRRALEREWGEDTEVTAPHTIPMLEAARPVTSEDLSELDGLANADSSEEW